MSLPSGWYQIIPSGNMYIMLCLTTYLQLWRDSETTTSQTYDVLLIRAHDFLQQTNAIFHGRFLHFHGNHDAAFTRIPCRGVKFHGPQKIVGPTDDHQHTSPHHTFQTEKNLLFFQTNEIEQMLKICQYRFWLYIFSMHSFKTVLES